MVIFTKFKPSSSTFDKKKEKQIFISTAAEKTDLRNSFLRNKILTNNFIYILKKTIYYGIMYL